MRKEREREKEEKFINSFITHLLCFIIILIISFFLVSKISEFRNFLASFCFPSNILLNHELYITHGVKI